MQRICILAFINCQLVHVCVSLCLYVTVDQRKTDLDKSTIFHHLVDRTKAIERIFGDIVSHDLDLPFEG